MSYRVVLIYFFFRHVLSTSRYISHFYSYYVFIKYYLIYILFCLLVVAIYLEGWHCICLE